VPSHESDRSATKCTRLVLWFAKLLTYWKREQKHFHLTSKDSSSKDWGVRHFQNDGLTLWLENQVEVHFFLWMYHSKGFYLVGWDNIFNSAMKHAQWPILNAFHDT
jgi:hypothetical protein